MEMKAVGLFEFGGPEVLQTIAMEQPVPGDFQVRIKVQGTSVNFADLQTRKGAFHGGGAAFPVIPGLDAMGIVDAVGAKVTKLKEGDRVIAFPASGTYASYVLADEDLVFPVPEALAFEQAAACPLVSFTSHMLLAKVAELQKGETVLLHAAAGGIGTTAIQIARRLGAGTIIGTVGNSSKAGEALAAGADIVVSNEAEDFVTAVNEATGGKGADIILDPVGGTVTGRGMGCLAPYGRLVVFGNASGSYGEISTQLLHSSCRSVRGFSSVTTRKTRPGWFGETAEAVLPLLASGAVTMKIARVMDLEEAGKAHELLESRTVTGKIVLRV